MLSERQIFERFFPRKLNPNELTKEIVAFGIYQFLKWDRIRNEGINDPSDTPSEYFRIANGFTENEIDIYERNASQALDSLTDHRRELDALRLENQQDFGALSRRLSKFWPGIVQSMAGGFLLLVLLAIAYGILAEGFGIDFLRVWKAF